MVVAFKRVMLRVLYSLLILVAFATNCFGAQEKITVPDGPIASALLLVNEKRTPEAISILESLSPELSELGPYYYVYGRAIAAGDPVKSAYFLRLSSVYSIEPEMQEATLLMAAETEFRAGYSFEAKNSCRIFLRRFPDSVLKDRIHILLGRILANISLRHDAIIQFEKAGNTPEALFGKANTLQSMGMTIEASRAYSEAMAKDPDFPDRDDDTLLWMGENFRISGLTPRAKNFLSKVAEPENLEYATFALAEIAAEELKIDNAIWKFESLVSSKNRKLGRMAMLRAADLDASMGRVSDAAKRLEEIVVKYPFTAEYDQAALRLARIQAASDDEEAALSLLARLVARPSTVRAEALEEIERVILSARMKGPQHIAALWGAGGRWIMEPSRESTLLMVADELVDTDFYEEIVQWLSRYGSPPVRSRFLAKLAYRYAAANDVDELRAGLQKLQAVDVPGDAVTRAEAQLKFAEKDFAGAQQTLLSLGSMEKGDLNMLGELLPHLTDSAKAIAALEAAAGRPDIPSNALVRLADAHYDASRKEKAIKYYLLAAEKNPADEWSSYRLFVLLDNDKGEEYRKRIVKDQALARMADAIWKERNLDGE